MTAQTRRERRAVQLAERRAQRRSRVGSASRSRARSPIALLSAGAVLAGAAIVGALIISAPAPGSGTDTGEIRPPVTSTPPAALVHGRSLGDPDAPVRIELWADFQCPACGAFTRTIEPRLRSTYIADGTVQLTYRDLAFIGPESLDAAVAARIAEEYGPGFWSFHDLLFANQAGENRGGFGRERLGAMAELLGMERVRFLGQLDDPGLRAAVRSETSSGAAAGIDQTPTLVVDGVAYAGSPRWDRLAELIDQLAAGP